MTELLALGGAYTRLYDLQLREQEEFEERMLGSQTDSLGGRTMSIKCKHSSRVTCGYRRRTAWIENQPGSLR